MALSMNLYFVMHVYNKRRCLIMLPLFPLPFTSSEMNFVFGSRMSFLWIMLSALTETQRPQGEETRSSRWRNLPNTYMADPMRQNCVSIAQTAPHFHNEHDKKSDCWPTVDNFHVFEQAISKHWCRIQSQIWKKACTYSTAVRWIGLLSLVPRKDWQLPFEMRSLVEIQWEKFLVLQTLRICFHQIVGLKYKMHLKNGHRTDIVLDCSG